MIMKHCLEDTSITLISALIVLFTASCTVKEDRSECPCYLKVDFTDSNVVMDSAVLLGWQEDKVLDANVAASGFKEGYTCTIPRGLLSFGAAKCPEEDMLDGHSVFIRPDQQCDSLYAFCENIDCRGETARTEVVFHKQFATVYLRMVSSVDIASQYDFIVESNSCGIDILTCKALEGYHKLYPVFGSEGRAVFRLLRQVDDSLHLTVLDESGNGNSFPLGQYISSLGYDWDAADLSDIYITLDIVQGEVSAGIAAWEQVSDFELNKVNL